MRTWTKVLEVDKTIVREILTELLLGTMQLPTVMMKHFLMIWILVWLIGSNLGGPNPRQTSVVISVAGAMT
jgi:phosphate/sulfate permease